MKNILKSLIIALVAMTNIGLNGQSSAIKIIDEFNEGVITPKLKGLDQSAVPEATAYFKELAYSKAIKAYLKKENKLTQGDKLRLAQSFAKADRHEEATDWFSNALDDQSEPGHILMYAQSLQASGYLAKAQEQYAIYTKKLRNSNANRSTYVFNGDIINETRFDHHDVQIYNESKINTEALEFSPSFYNDGIVYVSTNPQAAEGGDLDPWIDENFMSIYHATRNEEGYLTGAKEFSEIISTKYHEGPLAFTSDGEELFFTRNSFENGKKDLSDEKVLKLKIFQTKNSSNGWTKPKHINFTTADYQECHPTLSADGNTMIFASDRKGSIGKMDLFMSKRNGGSWSNPINLGSQINTQGNELFPFIHENGMLYFASDTHDGLGSLDLFVSQQISDNQWSTPKNMGTPFNSSADDFGYIIDSEMKRGYFTSSRANGFGKDDIYGFELTANPFNDMEVVICTVDSLTREQLAASTLDMSILNATDDQATTITTMEDGCIRMEVHPDKTYRFYASNDEYHTSEAIFQKSKDGNTWTIPLYKPGCVYLTGTVTNEGAGNKIEGAEIILTNMTTGDIKTLKTDLRGNFTQCLPCGQDFDIKASKTGFSDGMAMISTVGTDCSTDKLLTTNIPMSLIIQPPAVYPEKDLGVGKVLVLDNIYYDFDESYIKDEEQIDLDRLVNTMHQYPGLVIELGSHTDARGTDAYNQSLSERRALAALEYITNRGISELRIIPIGYGENQIRNHCGDGVKCTEDEHLYNRRTEVRVLENDNTNLAIQYQDNLPTSYLDIEDQMRYTGDGDIVIGKNLNDHMDLESIDPFDMQSNTSASDKNPIGLFVGSYSNYWNAEKKRDRLIELGYEQTNILSEDINGNHRVAIETSVTLKELQKLKSELLNQGIRSVVRYE